MSITSERREALRERQRWESQHWREIRDEKAATHVKECMGGKQLRPADSEPRSLASEYLTVEELADELRVCRTTLDRWHRLRVGPPRIKISGGYVRYRRSAVEEWLKDHEQAGVRDSPLAP
jgi:predicted DNA-binding transcriptional regulator AlpA